MLQRTYCYRLYPSPSQARLLDVTLETCRHFYNDCLAERKMAYQQGGETLEKYAQLRQVKVVKATNPWAKNVHSHVLQTVVQDLDKAFVAFFRRVKAGEKPGYPRFKGRNRWRSFGFKEYGNGFKLDGRRLKLALDLITRYDRIALEDLTITRMAHGTLAKSILDAGWGYLVNRLTYKAESAGRVVVLVDPRYTSKTCSSCGHIFENLTLSDRWINCACGLSLDRDHNAAINILHRGGQLRWALSTSVGVLAQEADGL